MKSRVFGTLASIMMIISLLTYFPAIGASAEETLVNDSTSGVSVNNDDYSVSGTTSFGKMFSDSIDEKSQEQEDNDGYNVFAAEYSEQNSFYVSFETKENCTLLVGIYDEAGEKMLASGRQAVTFDETEKIVEIDTGVIPDYYYLKVFLVDDNSLRPLCKAYQSPNYTREMQEFFQKDTDDFEDDKVLNFDSDKDNNFAVYSDDTIIIDRKDGVNDVVLSDLENEKYTIENIDSSISSLKEGDIFAYQYSDDDALIVKIKSIDIDGTTANITGDDVDMENVFEYVKIDAEQGAADAEVDTSGCDDSTVYKGVEIEDQNESTPDTENGIQPQLLAADADASLKGTFVYEFLGAKNNEDDPDSHLKGSLKMGVSANIKLYISAKYQYLELKLSADVTINVSIEDKASLSIPLGEARYIPVTGVTIKYKMAFVVEVKASLKYEVKYTLASVGFSVSSDVGFKNLTKKPTTEYTPELSTSISAFIGMQYTLKASFISEKIVDASLTTRIGFTINASAVIATTNDSVIHDCILCFDGDMTPEISFVAKCKLFNSNKLSWEAQLFDLKLKVLNFYYCNDLHKFGWGECPRKKYKVTYTVYDENKDPVKDAVIDTGVKNIEPLTTNDSGTATAYLKAGTYKATLENYKDSKEKEYVINEKRTSVRLSTKGADLSDTVDDSNYENDEKNFYIDRHSDGTCMIMNYYGKKTKVKIPKEVDGYIVTDLHWFWGNDKITDIIIPEGNFDFNSQAFSNCRSLKNIYVDPNNKRYSSDNGIMFSKNKDTIIRFPKGRSETEYVIPDSVIKIGDNAFEDCSNLLSITIPNGVTTIGNAAFECTSISAIDIPESVTEIGGSSFRQCVKLEEIDIPKNVEYIESYTFYYCKALQKVTIKGNITGIGYYAFSICSSLKEINIPNSLKEIGDYVFGDCSNLENIELPDGFEKLGEKAFVGCEKLTQIKIPSTVNEIGEYAFASCSNLNSIDLSTGITTISKGAFKDCRSLSSIDIPDTVKYLGESCFENCTSLSAVSLPNQITLIFERLFYNCSSLVNIDLPDTVQYIMREAFASCTALVSIELPNNITELGSMAFSNCSNLENVNIPNKITYINYGLFKDCKNLNHIIIPENVEQIDDRAFSGCESLGELTIPNSVHTLGKYAFAYCSSFTEIIIPDSVITIGNYAFVGCSSATKITIPDSVTTIGDSALERCLSLTEVIVPDSVSNFGKAVFSECTNLERVKLPKNIDGIPYRTFFTCEKLTDITYPSSIEYIGIGAFVWCKSLKDIVIPDGVTEIGEEAFACCNFVSISIPDTVTSIGSTAFRSCEFLENVKLSNQLQGLERGTFEYCSSLTNITVPNSVTYIGTEAFIECKLLKDIQLSNQLKNIGDYSFKSCVSLTHITIPNTVTYIGYEAFNGSGLKTVTMPDGVYYGWSAFPSGVEFTYTTPASSTAQMAFDNSEVNTLTADSANTVVLDETSNVSEIKTQSESVQPESRYAYFKNLHPKEIYNFYVIRSFSTDDLMSADNLLYISQVETDEDGKLSILYAPLSDYDDAQVFVIPMNQTDISDAEITIDEIQLDNGKTSLVPQVKLGEKTLTEGLDYEVYGETLVDDVSEYALTINGIGLYCGTVEKQGKGHTFSDWTITKQPTCTEDGEETRICSDCGNIETKVIPANGHTIVIDKAIAATCTSTGKTEGSHCSVCGTVIEAQQIIPLSSHKSGNWIVDKPAAIGVKGSKHKECTVCGKVLETAEIPALSKQNIQSATITLSKSTYVYDGKAKKPSVTVKLGGKTLKNGTDYTVSYSNNVKAGTATVKITGNGDYTGSVSKKFSIKNDFKQATVTGISTKTYNGKSQTQKITVKFGGKTLKNGTDYTVSYSNNKKIGTASMKIVGKGDYAGTIERSFKINPVKLSISKLTAKSKGFKASWAKNDQATGYEIKYGTNSKFKSAKKVAITKKTTTAKTITKLKASKKYFVRMRIYTTVNGKKYYGAWSAVKTVTIKK